VHLYTALVMSVVLGFILTFGHQLNDVLTCSLATRYQNIDLIEELKGKTRAAHEARAAAETANRTKSQLLAAASHDLRQPLHALGLYTAALSARAAGAEWRPLVGSVQRAVAALEGQFEQLLDLSRLESGALSPVPSRIALQPLLARVMAELEPHAQAKGLVLRVAPTRAAVQSDTAMLERIIRTLAVNAIRSTAAGGVLIGARRRGEAIAIDVIDTGVGIAPSHQARIFEEFYQVRDSRSDGVHAGMGLGLAIVRRLAALLEHRVEVASRVGRGSRFRIVAPRAATGSDALARACNYRTAERPAPTAIPGALVGVIDDDPASVDAMSTLLTTWGAEVARGEDLETMLAALGAIERYPDLVVADLRLADGRSGVDAIQRLRDELGVPVPALLVSGDLGPIAERDARAAGLMLLPKPVVPTVLHALATALIARGTAEAATRA
jgi:signal transduction histidine kinase/CheY-like chemotaxis protein